MVIFCDIQTVSILNHDLKHGAHYWLSNLELVFTVMHLNSHGSAIEIKWQKLYRMKSMSLKCRFNVNQYVSIPKSKNISIIKKLNSNLKQE